MKPRPPEVRLHGGLFAWHALLITARRSKGTKKNKPYSINFKQFRILSVIFYFVKATLLTPKLGAIGAQNLLIFGKGNGSQHFEEHYPKSIGSNFKRCSLVFQLSCPNKSKDALSPLSLQKFNYECRENESHRSEKNLREGEEKLARLTGLEPATPGVTGRYSNQLSYNRAMLPFGGGNMSPLPRKRMVGRERLELPTSSV